MPAGSIQSVVVCVAVDAPTSAFQQSICPVVDGRYFAPGTTQAYVLDPSQQNNFEAAVGPFDYVHAAAVWSAGFTMVVGLYLVSLGIGSVVAMVRRG